MSAAPNLGRVIHQMKSASAYLTALVLHFNLSPAPGLKPVPSRVDRDTGHNSIDYKLVYNNCAPTVFLPINPNRKSLNRGHFLQNLKCPEVKDGYNN